MKCDSWCKNKTDPRYDSIFFISYTRNDEKTPKAIKGACPRRLLDFIRMFFWEHGATIKTETRVASHIATTNRTYMIPFICPYYGFLFFQYHRLF